MRLSLSEKESEHLDVYPEGDLIFEEGGRHRRVCSVEWGRHLDWIRDIYKSFVAELHKLDDLLVIKLESWEAVEIEGTSVLIATDVYVSTSRGETWKRDAGFDATSLSEATRCDRLEKA